MIGKPLTALTYYKQFILYRQSRRPSGAFDKIPLGDINDKRYWLSYDKAEKMAEISGLKVGFVFTKDDPFFFLDIDGCRRENTWSSEALTICSRFPKAAIEVSCSGNGLHIIGMYRDIPAHRCKNGDCGLELYHEKRFMALGLGGMASGSIGDCTEELSGAIAEYFCNPISGGKLTPDTLTWTVEACKEWAGPADDAELLKIALRAKSGASIFGKKASFRDLYEGNESVFPGTYPDKKGDRPYDSSSVDMAAVQYLMFYTGKNCERTLRIVQTFEALRAAGIKNRGYDKWSREDYLPRTIIRAFSLQQSVYNAGKSEDIPDIVKYPALKGSAKQKEYAEKVRSAKLEKSTPEQYDILVKQKSASFWIESKDEPLPEMVEKCKPNPMDTSVKEATIINGYQFMGPEKQLEYFRDCVYVVEQHAIFTPANGFLKPEQFTGKYSGFSFQIDELGGKTSRDPWDVFIKSQAVRFPKVDRSCFRPHLPPGTVLMEEGATLFNSYVPYAAPLKSGDASPFIDHVRKLIPDERDFTILMSYLAALIQYRGVKFRWAPLIQGTYGNGKTTISDVMVDIIGYKYSQVAKTKTLTDDFDSWLERKLFIGIEDIYSPTEKREMIEILKPMITNTRYPVRGMHQVSRMIDNYANFILNTNNKDALAKDKNDRRYCVFYTAQQCKEDKIRDGLTSEYFMKLKNWLAKDGTAIVHNYLMEFKIPDEFNPATCCQEAPKTSSTDEAIKEGLSPAQQEIVEAVESETQGFVGGFISSGAVKCLNPMFIKMSVNSRSEILRGLDYVRHPALKGGRSTAFIMSGVERGQRPIVWVKKGHPSLGIADGGIVSEMFMRAQGYIT
jgi:primase-polymerase (primpol)-like protein